MRKVGKLGVIATLLVPAIALVVACGGGSSSSVSASGEAASAGVVKAKPADAAQVSATLREWSISTDQASVRAGQVYFLVDNAGPEDAHEFVIISTNLSPNALPIEKDRVPEEKVKIIGEIEPFTAGSKASIAVNLPAGNYALICNIAEVENGQVESHYKLGMYTAFEVQ